MYPASQLPSGASVLCNLDFHKDNNYNIECVLNVHHVLGIVLSTSYVLISPHNLILPVIIAILWMMRHREAK